MENFRLEHSSRRMKKKAGNHSRFRFCLFFSIFFLASFFFSSIDLANAASGSNEQKVKLTEEQLDNVNSKIKSVQSQLSKDKHSQKNEQDSLKKIEQDLATLYKKSRNLKNEQHEVKEKINKLKNDEQALEKKNEKQKTALKNDLQALYKLGRQEKIKLLLNQENPEELARLLKYYDYYSEARVKRILDYQKNIKEISEKRKAIEQELIELEKIDEKISEQTDKLKKSQSERSALLAAISANIKTNDQKLRLLQDDQSRLSKLLRSLKGIWADIPSKLNHVSISKSKGKLPFPVKDGKIIHSFGSHRAEGLLTWNGWFIEAPLNENVRAVHDGRVVFSDWIRGYGLLIIIDHSDGYLSLYGHNASLLKDTGDWIQTGDVLGTVGNSGGQYESGLYFELRKDGEPINPKYWLKR